MRIVIFLDAEKGTRTEGAGEREREEEGGYPEKENVR